MKVKASTMVQPNKAMQRTTLELSNLDTRVFQNQHSRILYFYRSSAAADFFDTAVLKDALSRTLVEFYPVAGRLNKDDAGRTEIDCNGQGVLFLEAESDGAADDYFLPTAEISLVPDVDYSLGISTFPLLLLQVTRFKCGGVCLGNAIDHRLSDGPSFNHFMNTWSDMARGLDITVLPFFDRRILSPSTPPKPRFSHIEYHPPPVLRDPRRDASEIIMTMFKMTRDQLNTLKVNCNEDGHRTYSTYQVLAGHIWQCVTKARGLSKNQETKLYMLVDGRPKLRPSLPQGYFGNVVFKVSTIATCGELESSPLKFAAQKIQETLGRMDNEYLRSAIDYLEFHDGLKPIRCPNLAIFSVAGLPFYDADFGWGRPVYVGIGSFQSEGKFYVMQSPTNDGSLLFTASLPKEQMQVFEKLLYLNMNKFTTNFLNKKCSKL